MPGFPALRVDHLAVAVHDIAPTLAFLQRYLPVRMHQEPVAGYDDQFIWTDFLIGDWKVELIASARPGSFVERFINRRGEGFHHLCIDVEDGALDAYLAAREREGLRIVERTDFGDGQKTAFISPRTGPGILVQLWQMTGFHEAPPPGYPPDPVAQHGGVRFRVDHLGIAVRSIDQTLPWFRRTFPVDVLGGVRPGWNGGHNVLTLSLAGLKIDLLEPTRPEAVVARFVEQRGEGFHHLTIDVDRLSPLVERLEADRIRLACATEAAGGPRTALIHPRDAHGLVLHFREDPDFDRGRRR